MNKLPLLFVLLATACATDEPTETDSMEDIPWQEMDFEQRSAYMASDVMPTMQVLFADYDADRFATITCATCHGDGVTEGTFSMPSSSLFPLDLANFPTGPGADFMQNEVVPTMADLLDQEPFDPVTNLGFGCLGCHTTE